MNSELQKIANWFRSNKMAINTAKTKFIVFRTRGKRINPADCNLIFNNNEIGQPEDPSLLFPIMSIMKELKKASSCWVYFLTGIFHLMSMYPPFVEKFPNPSSA